jgi:hypothetical protein
MCPQQLDTCPYPQPDYSNPYPKLQIEIHFNINLPYMPWSTRWSNQNLAHISSPPNIFYMPYISHPLQVDHKDTILYDMTNMTLSTKQFSSASCYFLPLRPKYLPLFLSLLSTLNILHMFHIHALTLILLTWRIW